MTRGQNNNHPSKGSKIKVEPIKDLKDIKDIKKMLSGNPRNLALFVLGINTNLRASDLCRITVDMVRDLKPMDEIEIKEKKTGKTRRINLNGNCAMAIHNLLAEGVNSGSDGLFRGQRGDITPIAVHTLVKGWCKAAGLKGNYGSHTLRKTFGYIQHEVHNVGIPELMVCFNHSSERQTLAYLCIQPEKIRAVYANGI